mgnify:CR=1 FL=1
MSFTEIKSTLEFIEAALGNILYSGQQNTYAMAAAFRALAGLKDECDARIHQEQQGAKMDQGE